MRITEPALGTLLSRLNHLHEYKNEVTEEIDRFLKYKKEDGPADWKTRNSREMLELKLGKLRRELSQIYDLMHDRGLANFETGWLNETGVELQMHPIKQFVPVDDIDDWVPGLNQFMRGGNIEQGFVTKRDPKASGAGIAEASKHDSTSNTDLQSDRYVEVASSNEEARNGSNVERPEDDSEVYTEYHSVSGWSG